MNKKGVKSRKAAGGGRMFNSRQHSVPSIFTKGVGLNKFRQWLRRAREPALNPREPALKEGQWLPNAS